MKKSQANSPRIGVHRANWMPPSDSQVGNYANGTAKVKGRGTSTSDSVPARLSVDEAVLPADTVKAIGVKSIAKLIAATHKTAPKIGVRRGGKYADGVVPEDEKNLPAPAITLPEKSMIPGAEYGRYMADTISDANAKGGVPAAIGAGIRTAIASPLAVIDDVASKYLEPTIRPYAQVAKTLVTGDATPIGQEAIAPSAAPKSLSNAAAPKPLAEIQPATAQPIMQQGNINPDAARGYGVNRPVADRVNPQPKFGVNRLPQYGDDGAGYLRNEQTGATQVFNKKPVQQAIASATQQNVAKISPEMQQLKDWVDFGGHPDNKTARANHAMSQLASLSGANTANTESQTRLHDAQAKQSEQITAHNESTLRLQEEEANPNTTPERRKQIRDTLNRKMGRDYAMSDKANSAKAILASMDASPEDRAAAIEFLRSTFSGEKQSQGQGNAEALVWANANPKDPRAAQIKARLGNGL